MRKRHAAATQPFEKAGGYAPTMGIIGTVFGLVHVLSNLSKPETLGPSISAAFIATLLGIALGERRLPPDRRATEAAVPGGAALPRDDARGHPRDPGGRQPARRRREADGLRAAGRAPDRGGGGRRRRRRAGGRRPRRPRSAMSGRRKHKGGHHEEEHENEERWLVSFADMMTLLFCLFMVLFAISSVNTSKFEVAPEGARERVLGQDPLGRRGRHGDRQRQEAGGPVRRRRRCRR